MQSHGFFNMYHPRLASTYSYIWWFQYWFFDLSSLCLKWSFNVVRTWIFIWLILIIDLSVTTVSAFDEDGTPPNNETTFFIEKGGSDRFRIHGTTGVISVEVGAKFDRETVDMYNLTVIAIDKGDPQLTGSASVIVSVSDVNDELPFFGSSPYEVYVREDTSLREIIVNCTANDRDLDSHLQYSINGWTAFDFEKIPVDSSLIKVFYVRLCFSDNERKFSPSIEKKYTKCILFSLNFSVMQ